MPLVTNPRPQSCAVQAGGCTQHLPVLMAQQAHQFHIQCHEKNQMQKSLLQ